MYEKGEKTGKHPFHAIRHIGYVELGPIYLLTNKHLMAIYWPASLFRTFPGAQFKLG